LNGWNASNIGGRSVSINGAASISATEGNQSGTPASGDGYTYLDFSSGTQSYASCATW
jgi:hypothetical protein